MKIIFQTTDKQIYSNNAVTREQVSNFWKSHKDRIIWLLATEGTNDSAPVSQYYWGLVPEDKNNNNQKKWYNLLNASDRVLSIFRRLLTSCYLEAIEHGVDLEQFTRLDD